MFFWSPIQNLIMKLSWFKKYGTKLSYGYNYNLRLLIHYKKYHVKFEYHLLIYIQAKLCNALNSVTEIL